MTGIPVAPGELVDTTFLNEIARAHYRKTSTKTVVSSVAETDLLNGEVTIGAGALAANRAIRLTAWGDWVNNTGSTQVMPRLKLKLGGATLLDLGASLGSTFTTAATRFPWKVVCEIANLTAATQWATMCGMAGVSAAASLAAFPATGAGYIAMSVASGVGAIAIDAAAAGAVDTTAACALALTVINGVSNASYDTTLKAALVEIV